MKKVEEAISRKISGAVILLDLDNFKSINDTLGHVFGDKILELTANRLASICSEAAYVSRFGGDEFLILFECTDDKSDLYDFINEIYRGFEAPVSVEDNDILVEFSMGVSRFPEDSLVYNEIVMYADLALYTVKNTGKSNFAFFTNQMSEHLKEKIQIKAIIQDAIENPPQDTRAKIRGEFIKLAKEKKIHYNLDWSYIRVGNLLDVRIMCENPFQTENRRVSDLMKIIEKSHPARKRFRFY